HMTAWCYDNPDLSDVQFIKWDVINKSHTHWQSFYSSIVCDPDLGCAVDDFIGCDTTRNLGFCYNGEEVDCAGTYRYSGIVPSVGIQWLTCNGVQNLGMTSFDYSACSGCGAPYCELDPNPGAEAAYNFMRGLKKDATPWVVPPGGAGNVTRFVYSGNPETGSGWCEAQATISGRVLNCGGPGVTTGTIISPNPMGDRHMIINSGSDNLTLNAGDTQKVIIAQLIARGSNRRNSVTMLKILADTVFAYCSRGYIIGVESSSNNVPQRFSLAQNYPNPFNPVTKIEYAMPKGGNVELKVYDVLGKEVITLVNEHKPAGNYSVEFNGTNFASGVYFYKMVSGDFTAVKKMLIVK
ncbi:MAG: T9SS type A sorting domain-containing protein, partial [Ignavibacteria bacterium]